MSDLSGKLDYFRLAVIRAEGADLVIQSFGANFHLHELAGNLTRGVLHRPVELARLIGRIISAQPC